MASKPGRAIRRDAMLAKAEMERLGINPIEMLLDVYKEAMEGYRRGRGMGEKADTGAAWLSVARSAAADLCNYRHPKLSAVAIKDMSDPASERPPLSTAEAIKVIEADPFRVSDQTVIEQMKSGTQTPKLPMGGEPDGQT